MSGGEGITTTNEEEQRECAQLDVALTRLSLLRGLETGEDFIVETFADGRRATVLDAREDENENGGVVDAREQTDERVERD